ncbi:MAG TPA: redoxin domain-containing protein [Tepidisphaeraceae bacterium]|jgi:thiol-disulfide isomerase/thioredoxin
MFYRSGWTQRHGCNLILAFLSCHWAAGATLAANSSAKNLSLLVEDQTTGQSLPAKLIIYRDGHDAELASNPAGATPIPLPANSHSHFSVIIQVPGYVNKLLKWDAAGEMGVPDRYIVKMEKATTMRGRVTDDAGKTVAHAHVVIEIRTATNPQTPHEQDFVSYETVDSGLDGTWHFDGAPRTFEKARAGVWDYRYANGDYYPMSEIPAAQLRDGSATLVLQRGLPVTGIVRGPDGQPLAGAKVLTGAQMCSNRVPEQTTGADGRFAYTARPMEMVTLTIWRKGYSPELMQFGMGAKKKQVNVSLAKSVPMIGRVVGPDGKGVPEAWIYPDTWRGCRSLDAQVQADKEGKFVWNDAPRDTVYCDIDATDEGFLREDSVPLQASEHPITVKVRRSLRVSGTVVDAQTNQPIAEFTVVPGISWGDDRPIYWQHSEQLVRAGQDGQFKYEETQAQAGYATRIEAAGYLPADSRVFSADEQSVSLRFKLVKGTGTTVKVLAADGHPAAGAIALLALPGQMASTFDFQRVNDQGCEQATVATDGTLKFPPQAAGPFKVIIFGSDGYLATDRAALAKSDQLTLQPWSKIDGVLMIGNKPAALETVVAEADAPPYDPKQPFINNQLRTQTDAAGRFTFPRVAPGKTTVAREVQLGVGGGRWLGMSTQRQSLNLKTGQSSHVQLGGMGRQVTGHIIIPSELASRNDWYFGISELRLNESSNTSPLTSYPVQISQDGTWRADDVPAGTYGLYISAMHKTDLNVCAASGDELANAQTEMTVAPMPGGRSDVPLQISTLPLTLLKIIDVGKSAPDFSAQTLDGKNLSLASFRGKYVLLDFWATWCGPCREETPNVKAVYDTFGSNPRFAMISLSLDKTPADAQKYVKQNGLVWNQVFLPGQWEAATLKDFGVRGIPSIWLIGPDGKVIAKNLRGAAIKNAVASVLSP